MPSNPIYIKDVTDFFDLQHLQYALIYTVFGGLNLPKLFWDCKSIEY